MDKIENQLVQPESTPAGEGGVHRRRFVRGVGIIVPVALTITSRSASAAGCLSASASASINLANSRPNRVSDGVCSGRKLAYWKTAASSGGDLTARNQQFSLIYINGFLTPAVLSMDGVMNLAGVDPLSAHLAAAWCNLVKLLVDPKILSLTTLQSMWAGRTGGAGARFQPIPGNASVVWDDAQMVTYLQTTQLS